MATVVLAGTLDTKGTEYEYAAACMRNAGVKTITMDLGVLHDPEKPADIPAAEVARAAGAELASIRFAREGSDTRAFALRTMQTGAINLLQRMIAEEKCDAVFGMGGSGGTSMLSAAFQALPTGFPKLIVSTCMDGDVSEMVGTKDITMMYAVTDIAGINAVSRRIIGNAANAAAGMALFRENLDRMPVERKPVVAITMFGITTKGVLQLREKLERDGFDVIVFHCTGAGGRAMEEMIRAGLIDGVIDFTLAELNGHKISKMNDPGEDRLTAATAMRIPQVVVPGALEVCNFPGIAHLPEAYRTAERKAIEHNGLICAVRANLNELKELGMEIGRKLNGAGPETALLMPMGGLDSYMAGGGPWQDDVVCETVWESIRKTLGGGVAAEQLPWNINEERFTDAVYACFQKLWQEAHPA